MNFGTDMVSVLFMVSVAVSCMAALQILLDKVVDEGKKND